MNKCELCKCTARVYCESDQAKLCWSCDAKVHSANFLVARHVRALLCHSCQSLTPWTASGDNLGRTMSLCQPCSTKAPRDQKAESEEEFEESGSDYDDSEDEESSDDNNVDDDGDNQVVPMPSSMTLSSSPPPVVSSSGTSQDRSHIDINRSLKRSRACVADLNSKDDDADSLSIRKMSASETAADATCCTLRPFKFTKLEINGVGTTIPVAQQRTNAAISHLGDNGVEADESVQFDLNKCPFD